MESLGFVILSVYLRWCLCLKYINTHTCIQNFDKSHSGLWGDGLCVADKSLLTIVSSHVPGDWQYKLLQLKLSFNNLSERGFCVVEAAVFLVTPIFKFCFGVFWRRQWHPTPVLLPGKSHDGGAWWAAVHGVAKLDMTKQLHFHFSLSCIGEGNGSPLQCSCLENPRDEGAWWAAIYGVAQSRTRLKWLSSSSSSSSSE